MKWSHIKRVLSLTLCVLMVLSILPTSSLAEVTAAPTDTNAPVETTQPTPAGGSQSPTASDVAQATPTPASSDAAATPTPSDATTGDVVTDGPKTYVVDFVVDHQTRLDLQQTVADGGLVTAPNAPAVPDSEEYAGQIFLYWYKTLGKAYDFSTPVSSDLVLYAQFGQPQETPLQETPLIEETPIVSDESGLFSAFSMAGGIIPESVTLSTYTFVVAATTVATKIVANGDTLDAPEVPTAPAGQKFSGWYTDANTLFDSFGTQTVTADGATTLTAKFEPAYYVFFYNQFGAVTEVRTPDANNVVSTDSIVSLKLGSDQALVGWSLTSGGTTDVGTSVTVNGANINLYPIIQQVIWITFNSVGGTYISPMYIQPNTKLTQAAVEAYIATQNNGSSTISKAGYTFTGWTGFNFGQKPSSNVTLTAGWAPKTNTPYKLVYWIENADDSNYSFEKSVDKTGTTDAVINLTSAETANTNLNATYANYFNTGTYTAGQTIKGDGSTIVNIYHTRMTYTLTYKNGNTTLYTHSYKYDQDISAVWNIAAILNLSNQGYVWQSSITQDYYTILLKMPGSNLTMTATQWSGSTYSWYYYLETLDGTAATAPAGSTTTSNNGITYYLMKSVTIKGNNINLTYSEDYFPITGFYQRDSSVPTFTQIGSWPNFTYTANLFYRRSSYSLTFINGDTSNVIPSIKYQAPVSGYNYTPNHPSGVDASFTFNKWFATEAAIAGTEFNWTQTMPAKNIVLYANWIAPVFTGIAHSLSFDAGGGTTVNLGSITYGGTISTSALNAAQAAAEASKPHPTDTFGGWLILKNGSLILFNSSMQIYENVVLYPVWLSTLNFSVTYLLGDASGTAPIDSLTYVPGAQAQVKSYTAASVTPPADKVFIGWRSSVDNKIYYPNSVVTITQNTTLTAVWVYSASNVTITYDGNNGATSTGATTFTGGAVNNTYHTVQGNPFLYTGKNFIGWNTLSNGTGTWYNPGDNVLLGLSVPSAPGTLYAIWEDQTFAVTVTANPAAGVSANSGAGTYVYGTNTTVTWTVAAGYQMTSVTDNTVTVPVSSYTGNSYTLSGIAADHNIVINTQKTLYNLTYNGNGGTVGGNASYSSTKTMGTSFNVDGNTFTRAGYYFLGWSTSTGATTADPAYAPGTSVVMPGSDLTLYAVWAPKMALTLTANSSTQNFDNTEKSVSGITPSIPGLTIENAAASASGTIPGVYGTSFTNQAGLVIKSGGVNVTDRYTVTWAAGSLTINPLVTYRASADGSLIGTEWVAYGTGDATYNVTPLQNINVGSEKYYWLGTYSPATANDLIANTTIYASYSLNKTLVITADSATYTYDGTTRSVTTGSVNVSGVTVTGYTVSGSGTNVGTYTTSVTLGTVKIMNGSTDVTYQYNVSTVDGQLKITPATTTANSAGYTGTYDGTPHGITVTPTVAGSTVKYSLTNSTNPAEYSFTNPTETNATTGTTVYFVVTNPNYNPVFGNEQIVINKRVVALTTATASKEYDTLPLTDAAWSFDTTGNQGFLAGQGFATSATTGTITNVGTTDNTFGYTLNGTTAASNYTINVTKGKLTITASNDLSVSATDVTKKYDGSAYGVSASANVPSGTTIRYSETYSANPANYTMEISPTATHVDQNKTVYFVATNANYEPAFGHADVTITPRTITLTAATESRAYNGSALTNATVTPTGDSFLSGEGFATQPTANGTITDVGTVKNNVVAGTLNASTQPHDYTFTPVAGDLTITARALTVQAEDKQIAYPANRPATSELTYSIVSGTVSGETPAFGGALGYDAAKLPASQPYTPGTYADAIVGGTLALTNSGDFKASNYALTVLPADLKVINGGFTVDLTGGSWTYNGNPHTTGLTGTNSGDTVEYFIPNGSGGWTSVGPTPPSVTNVADGPLTVKVVVNRPGYDPAEDTTTIAITPATTTANSAGYTGTYDGTPHGITVTP
ncbi:MAG: InlB B-repeat-containing protein, partial [Clostridiaceae bacterium]